MTFQEHRVPRGAASIYVRDHAGAEPAFVLMHGLPDSLGIYDELVPLLTQAGRRVVTFDFLGFGASDKPNGGAYGYAQQVEDLAAVVTALQLGPVVLVPHDSSGFAGINFAIDQPGRVVQVAMLNSAYADTEDVFWPPMIELAAQPALRSLAKAIFQHPAQFGWLLGWQQEMFAAALPEAQRDHFRAKIGGVIQSNFTTQPSAGPAFAQLTAQFYPEIARNVARLPLLEQLDIPIRLIWGDLDPYLNLSMAEARMRHLKLGSLHVVSAGHWLQSDAPAEVAQALLL